MFYRFKFFPLALMALMVMHMPTHAADNFNEAQKAEIEKLVKEYLLENGGVIMEAVDKHRKEQQEKEREQTAENVKKALPELTSADSPAIGSANPDITVVEFFDYNCGYCKRALPDIQKLVEADKNVRVVFREMPILGPSSKTAAEWAMAAHKQGKYFEFHAALMNHRGQKTEGELSKIAEKLELDVEQMKKDAKSDAVAELINNDVALARKVGISGTPAFIIGEELFPGYLGPDGLKGAVEVQRKKGDKKG